MSQKRRRMCWFMLHPKDRKAQSATVQFSSKSKRHGNICQKANAGHASRPAGRQQFGTQSYLQTKPSQVDQVNQGFFLNSGGMNSTKNDAVVSLFIQGWHRCMSLPEWTPVRVLRLVGNGLEFLGSLCPGQPRKCHNAPGSHLAAC